MVRGQLIRAMRSKGYAVAQKPWELNIVGIRGLSTRPNRFDDRIVVFLRDDRGKWQDRVFPVTTDPGTYWLGSPMHPQGTAILEPGQYPGYSIGMHRGQYPALVQGRAEVTVRRDYDRDNWLDFQNGTLHRGQFGINLHRANRNGTTLEVDRHSAGCQVFASASDFGYFMQLCAQHRRHHGNHFTYTLFDLRMLRRRRLRQSLLLLGGAGIIGTLLAFTLFAPQT